MRRTSIIFISIVLLVSSCSKDSNPVSSGETSAAITSLSGQIVGWRYSGRRFITVEYRDSQYFIGTSASEKIDSLGRFSISNLGVPPSNAQSTKAYPAESQYTKFIENSLTCSDSSARLIYAQLEVVDNDSLPPWVGWVARTSYDFNLRSSKAGDFDVSYFYVTKDVKVNGTVRAWISPGDTTAIDEILHYDLNFRKGWNQRVRIESSYTTYRDSNKTIYRNEYSFVNKEPYPANWYYYGH